MYSDDEYDNEQDTKTNDNFIVNFYYNNKILIWILIGVVVFILLMSLLTRGGSSNPTKNNYNVTIVSSDEVVRISIGNTYLLRAKVENNAKAKVVWSSENENIATVDSGSGVVTAVNYGTTKIYATYIHNETDKYVSQAKEVIVSDGNPNLKLTDVSFQNGNLLMPLNSKYQIRLSINPSNAYVTNKVFTSSNENVVTVDSNGLVTSVGEGEATVILNVNDGAFKKELRVFVNRDYTRSEIIVSPEKITFDSKLIKMKIGSREKLKYTLFPTDSNATKLIWTSSDESIVTFDSSGIVKALKAGRATITLKSITGVSDYVDIEVEENIVQVTNISLNVSSLYMTIGKTETLTPVVSPADASNKSLTYMVGDSNIVAIAPNQTGTSATVYALRAGTTTITISSNNNIEKRLTVTVAGNNSGGNSESSGSSSGGSQNNSDIQGFTISSKDANGEGFIVGSYNQTINNSGVAPINITITKNKSTISKIRVAVCPYNGSTSTPSCDPSASSAKEFTSSIQFALNGSDTYLLRIATYNSKGAQIGSYDKFIAVQGGSGNSNGKTKCNKPTNLRIENGIIKWTISSNCKSAQYRLVINNSMNSTVVNAPTNGTTVSYRSNIGSIKTIEVKTLAPNANYENSDYATYTIGGNNENTCNIANCSTYSCNSSTCCKCSICASDYYTSTDGSSCIKQTKLSNQEITISFPSGKSEPVVDGKKYVWMRIDDKNESTIYFCVGLSSSRSKTPSGAIKAEYGDYITQYYWYQPSGTCNKYQNSTYVNLYVPAGAKICASAERSGISTYDKCVNAKS